MHSRSTPRGAIVTREASLALLEFKTLVDSTAEKIVSAIRDHAFSWLRKPFTTRAVRDMVASALAAPPLKDEIQVLSASPRWLAHSRPAGPRSSTC